MQDLQGLLSRVLFRLRLWSVDQSSVDGWYSFSPSIDVEAILFSLRDAELQSEATAVRIPGWNSASADAVP